MLHFLFLNDPERPTAFRAESSAAPGDSLWIPTLILIPIVALRFGGMLQGAN